MKYIYQSNRVRIYVLIVFLALFVTGWSTLYLYTLSKSAGTEVAKTFPAPKGSDAAEYAILARNMINYHSFSQSYALPLKPDTNRTPGYPFILAISYYFWNSLIPVLIFQMILCALSAIILFKMGEKMFGTKWALFVTVLYLLDPNTFFGASVALTENVFVFFFLLIIYILFFWEKGGEYLRWSLAGLLLALAAYIRPVALYLPSVFILGYVVSHWSLFRNDLKKYVISFMLFITVFGAALLPWYIRNKEVSGVWGFCSISAYNLFRHDAALFRATMQHRNVSEIRRELMKQAGLTGTEVPKELQYAPVMQKVAFQVIFSDPIHYAMYRAGSTLSFFVSSGLHQYLQFTKDVVGDFARKSEPALSQALATMSWPMLVEVIENHGPLLLENLFWFIITMTFVLGLWKSADVKRVRFFAFLVIYFAITSPLSANARYRVPITPLLLLGSFAFIVYVLPILKLKLETIKILQIKKATE